MKRHNIILVIICFLLSNFTIKGNNPEINKMWIEAEQLYKEQKYEEAAEIYSQILSYGVSANIYYNYANSLFKTGEIGKSILYYERALRLAPNDENIKFNLQYANNAKTDKIDPIQPFFVNVWISKLEKIISPNVWAHTSIISFIITLILILIYLFGKILWLRKVSFFSAFVTLLICITTICFAFSSKKTALERNEAIVMEGSVSVKSSPDESGTEVFVIHEGTKVTIRSSINNWYEIKISDGNLGWLKASSIEII